MSKGAADDVELSDVLLFDKIIELVDDFGVVSLKIVPEDFDDHLLFVRFVHFFGNDPTVAAAFHFFIEHFLEEHFNFCNELLLFVVLVTIEHEIGRFDEESAYFVGAP